MYAGQDFTSSGIFTPKSDRFGSGIFASGWSIPKSVYTEPMYVGAQIVPGDMAFFRDALSGFDDLAAKFPGGKLGMAALAGLALYFTVGIPVLGWKAGKARRNPGRRRRRHGRRINRRRRPSRQKGRAAAAHRKMLSDIAWAKRVYGRDPGGIDYLHTQYGYPRELLK